MDPVLLGGLLAIGGTVVGTVGQEGIRSFRDWRTARARRRHAVSAVAGELLDAMSILDKALERKIWWSDGDEPRSAQWERHQDALADELDDDTYHAVRIAYECLRSLASTRNDPFSTAPLPGRLDFLRRRPPVPEPLRLFWLDGRWPWAERDTRNAMQAAQFALGLLWPISERLKRRKDRRGLDLEPPEPEAAEPAKELDAGGRG